MLYEHIEQYITKIVDNPISIRQAFWSPYKKLVRLVEEQVAKRAAASDSVTFQPTPSSAGRGRVVGCGRRRDLHLSSPRQCEMVQRRSGDR